jgi:hypothetical protein
MSDRQPPRRWLADPASLSVAERRACDRLAALPPPKAQRLGRQRQLLALLSEPPAQRSRLRAYGYAATALAAVALMVTTIAVREGRLRSVAPAADESAHFELLGPTVLEHDADHPHHVRLKSGGVIAYAGRHELSIETPRAHATLPPGAICRIEVLASNVAFAVSSERAVIKWIAGPTVTLSAGARESSDDVSPSPASAPARAIELPVRKRGHAALRDPHASAPVVISSKLADEAAVVRQAFEQLQVARDPEAALAMLDRHDQRFASGELSREVRRIRIDALLALHRRSVALALLDAETDLGSDLSGGELRLLRAALRLEARRPREALADYQYVKASPFVGLRDEVLYGEALCRALAGEQAEAQRLFSGYLEQFPRGKHAAEARAALGLK